MNDFLTWLNEELNRRSWSQNELARRMGYTHSAVYAVLSGRNAVTWEFCANAAKAFGLPPEVLFRKAGLLRPVYDETGVQQLTEVARGLPAPQLELLQEIALLLYRRANEG